MEGANWNSGSGAGSFSLTSSGDHASPDIGMRAAMPPPGAAKIAWRELLRDITLAAGLVGASFVIALLIMMINQRYGIVPALLTIIIILMISRPRKE